MGRRREARRAKTPRKEGTPGLHPAENNTFIGSLPPRAIDIRRRVGTFSRIDFWPKKCFDSSHLLKTPEP